jgi:nucleoside-diphosphate-sugar epimerase
MKAVIFGATGAIGMALAEKCIQNGVEVTALVRSGSDRLHRLKELKGVEVVEAGLEDVGPDRDRIAAAIGEANIFFHLAWAGTIGDGRNDMRLQNRNVTYTLDAVELASAIGCKVFVGAGSQAEYGRVSGMLKDDTPVNPENGYGIAKLCAGNMSRIRCRQLGITHIWTRILSVYGPYDGEKTMIISTIRQLLEGKKPQFTPGEQIWDYIYSADAAEAMLLLGRNALNNSGMNGRIYPIGSGHGRPLREYIEELRDAIDSDLELGLGDIPYGENQVMYLVADTTDLEKDTGFRSTTSFRKGISATIQWCRSGCR